MFDYSSDSLTDYVFSFPTSPAKPTPIVLERISDPNYTFDSIVPTTPSQAQLKSIKTGELPTLKGSNPTPSLFGKIRYLPSSSSDPESDPESPKFPFITNVYIASITVVGLFLLFRMIQK